MVNGLGVIVAVLLLFGAVFLFAVRSNYYRSVEYYLSARADSMETYLNLLISSDDNMGLSQSAVFMAHAGSIVSNYDYKETLELQLFDPEGAVFISSSGVVPTDGIPKDYKDAAQKESLRSVWRGENSHGEKIMAMSMLLPDSSGKIIGGFRFITSIERVNGQIILFAGLIALICGAVILFVMLSSTYFVNSIAHPIADVNRTARQIALGDYDSRIEKQADDEIGDLCDTINYMASEISAAEKLKNDFISSVSHELRTPLTAIKGWAETIRYGDFGGDTLTAKGLEIIMSESERLSGIVEELLDFSRMQSGHIAMKFERVDLLAELSEAVVMMNNRAEREGVEMVLIESDKLPLILGDGNRLKQVFINIIDNAIKYSNKGGRIRIECADMGSNIQVVISDTGIGISKNDLPHVMEKFFKVSNSRPGSGIGLALVSEIISRHRGTVSVDSDEGVGTTVTITLPIARSDGIFSSLE